MITPTNLWTLTNQSAPSAPPLSQNVSQLKISAESGDADAQVQLANYFYEGKGGLAMDRVEAYKWAAVAAAGGDKSAPALLREFEIFMPPDQITAGKTAAATFLKEIARQK